MHRTTDHIEGSFPCVRICLRSVRWHGEIEAVLGVGIGNEREGGSLLLGCSFDCARLFDETTVVILISFPG